MLPEDKKIETIAELETLANGVLNGMGNIYRVRFDSVSNALGGIKVSH